MHLLPEREEGHRHAGSDEEHRGDEAEPVGDHVGDDRGTNKCDDHVDGHEAAGLPSWAERGEPTAAGLEEGRSQLGLGSGQSQVQTGHSLLTLPSAPLVILDSST